MVEQITTETKIRLLIEALNARTSMPKFEEVKPNGGKRPRIIGSFDVNPFSSQDLEFFTTAVVVLLRNECKQDVDAAIEKLIKDQEQEKEKAAQLAMNFEEGHSQPGSQPPPTPEQ